jgi:hypothetical protein
MSESDSESEKYDQDIYTHDKLKELEHRLIALERGLEAVLSKMEASGQADDEPGWYGRPE